MNTEEKLISAMSGLVGIQQYLVGLPDRKSIGEQIISAPGFEGFKKKQSDMFKLETKTAILSTSATGDPLVQAGKPAIDPGVRRALNVRQLLREFPTVNGAVEVPVCSSKTNNAAVALAGSPEKFENVGLPESAYTFTTSFTEVRTLAHWIPVSAQILEDAGQLDSFLTGELAHGLNVAVEAQLVNGTGSNGQLAGLLDGATAYTVTSPLLTDESDILRDAIEQCQVADFEPTAIVLNPADWRSIDITIDTGGANRLVTGPRLWGYPVVVSNAIAAGQFLLGDFQRCGALFVRQPVTIEMARSDSSNWQKNMITIRALTRLALVVTNATALVKGSL